jgi:hypothetical protein
MAERRMMSKKIIHSDSFLDMPATSQNLYFHLLLEADDEGFVNSPKRIQRTVGATDGDAQMLLLKKFILSFESGLIVIKHWRMHNYIQNDRFKSTSHKNERAKLSIRDNQSYTLSEIKENVSISDTNCTPSIEEDSIGKVSKGKNNISVDLPDCIDANSWNEWVQHRKELKKTLTPSTIKKQITQLVEFNSLGMDTTEIINTSIAAGWAGLFRLRNGKQYEPQKSKMDITMETYEKAQEMKRQQANKQNFIDGELA